MSSLKLKKKNTLTDKMIKEKLSPTNMLFKDAVGSST